MVETFFILLNFAILATILGYLAIKYMVPSVRSSKAQDLTKQQERQDSLEKLDKKAEALERDVDYQYYNNERILRSLEIWHEKEIEFRQGISRTFERRNSALCRDLAEQYAQVQRDIKQRHLLARVVERAEHVLKERYADKGRGRAFVHAIVEQCQKE